MKNAFLIVNYNDYKSTKHLIDNIKNYKCIEEIVIVDNYSKEEDIANLSVLDGVTVIYNEENLGYSGAINVGADYLIKKYKEINLIISNSDIVILSEDDLVKLIDLLNDKKIGLVGAEILERGEILKGRKDKSINQEIISNFPLLNIFSSSLEYDNDYYEGIYSSVDLISTCFFLISSDTFMKINYMDENVFLYYEDYILGNKVKKLGLDVVICNEVKIKHLYSVSVDKNYKEKRKKRMLKDSILYYHSTYHKINKVQKILLKLACDLNILFTKKNKKTKS